MNDVVKMGKCGCIASGIWLVQGDTRSHVLTIHVPRMESGVDLKDLGWIIKITNEAGVDDVDVPVTGSVVIGERTIAFDWLIHGVATDVPGKTIFSIEGVDETEDGKPIIWRSSPATIYVREKHDATPSEEVEAELGELQKMIVYVNGELANVIAAGEMARSAATHPPIIGENGNWFLWDLEKEIYVDSGENTRGEPGPAGKSAYEIAKDNGFEGSEEEWLESLKGDNDNLFIIPLKATTSVSAFYYGFKYEDVKNALESNKAVILVDPNGKVYTYNYVLIADEGTDTNNTYFFHAQPEIIKGTTPRVVYIDAFTISSDNYAFSHKTRMTVPNPAALNVYDDEKNLLASYDGSSNKEFYIPTKLKNPAALHIRGAVDADYDGSSETTITIPKQTASENTLNTFVVSVTLADDGNDSGSGDLTRYDATADKTYSEIEAAARSSDTIVLCKFSYKKRYIYNTVLRIADTSIGNSIYFSTVFARICGGYVSTGTNYIEVRFTDDGGIECRLKNFITSASIPATLPNKYSLNIKQGDKSWSYDGKQTVNVEIEIPDVPDPVTSLPWDAITDKPFGEDVPLDVTIDSTAFDGYLYTTFVLTAGKKYTISCKIGEMAFDFTNVTAVEKNLDGLNIVSLGNLHLLNDAFEDTGEQYLLINIPDGLYVGDNVYVYGLVVINGLTVPEGVTIALKIENPDGATPIPEELIPTMSETTKGGAKVGKGLKMDGDTLNVDEGVWELIDSITCDGTYGNIARTGFALKQVEIDIHMMAAEQASSVGVEIKNEKELFGYAWIANLLNTAERYAFIRAHIENKNAYIEATSAGTSSYGSSPLSRSTSRHTDGGAIVRIGMYVSGGANFPEGSTIEIWGVRA